MEPSGRNCLSWKEQYWNRIAYLLQYVILSYGPHSPNPQGLDVFLKGLAELGTKKNLIGNEYLVPKLARFEDEVAESD